MDLQAIRSAPAVDDLDAASPRRLDERHARLQLHRDAALAVVPRRGMSPTLWPVAALLRGAWPWSQGVAMSDGAAERIMREWITAVAIPLSYQLIATSDLLGPVGPSPPDRPR